MIRVLFVCLGNICRSPMAEAVFRHKVREAGLGEHIFVDSAGTGYWHAGEPPHHGTRRVLDQYRVSYDGMRARQIVADDLQSFDHVLTMDDQNLEDVRAMAQGRAKVAPLLSYVPHLGVEEVPDPYYSGGFEGVYGLIDAACDALLADVRREHGL